MNQPDRNLIAEKKALRNAAKARRDAASPAMRADAAMAIARHGLSFLHPGGDETVSGFHPFGSEINDLALLKALASAGHVTALPVIEGPGQPLSFRRWSVGEPLVPGRWNIPVPREDAQAVTPDILLVPLLAFDRKGYRMGYGGGFYDRTLAGLRILKPVIAVGLAFAMQEVDKVPRAAYDARLDWVLTENGPLRFG